MQSIIKQLLNEFEQMNDNELQVMLTLARKLNRGSQKYGRWEAKTDNRNFDEELLSELLDGCNYLLMKRVQKDTA